MTASFHHKGLKDFWTTGSKKGIPAALAPRIKRILDAMSAAREVEHLNIPSYRLHELKGDRKGEWSIWVNGNWRITFKFAGGNVHDVNLEDYH